MEHVYIDIVRWNVEGIGNGYDIIGVFSNHHDAYERACIVLKRDLKILTGHDVQQGTRSTKAFFKHLQLLYSRVNSIDLTYHVEKHPVS